MEVRKKPWNRPNQPIYSISSRGVNGFNMNIVSYVTPVSMKPKRYMVAVYDGTQTLENVKLHPHFVLQLLSDDQYGLVRLLGKKSGRKIDKMASLEKKKLLQTWNEFPVLKGALAFVELKVLEVVSGGDHQCFICDVVSYRNQNEGEVLGLYTLGKHKIISI
jgi:flavin reductase (DIM6/NTAB) family NADH-FMN oxidoreductase RutF